MPEEDIPPPREKIKKNLSYYRRCLHCGKIATRPNYNCDCGSGDWTDEYRLTDVKYSLTEKDVHRALQAFRAYRMDHPRGMLQYTLMPHQPFSAQLKLRIGGTPFFELPELSGRYKRVLYIKDEGRNPGGSFKDRETAMAALNALATGRDRAVIYSSGNAAASAALLANQLDLALITCVSGDTYTEKVDYIRKLGSDVVRIGDSHTNYEQGYRLFAQLNNEGFFTGRGLDNWSVRNPFRVTGDKTTALEVVRQFGQTKGEIAAVPDYVVVPTGNGSCLAGMWKGFVELKKIGAIDKLPKMVSAAIKNASPVYQAFQKGRRMIPEVCDLDKVADPELEIGSVIVAEEGYDSIAATEALFESGGTAMVVTRAEIQSVLIDLLDREWQATDTHDLLPEPASLVALAAVARMNQNDIGNPCSSVVAVMTGHGSKALEIMEKLLSERADLCHKMLNLSQRQSTKPSLVLRHKARGHLVDVAAEKSNLQNAINGLNASLQKSDTRNVKTV